MTKAVGIGPGQHQAPPPTLAEHHWVFSFGGDQKGRRKSRNKWALGSQDQRLKEQLSGSRMWHGWSAWVLLVTLGEFWEAEAGFECVTQGTGYQGGVWIAHERRGPICDRALGNWLCLDWLENRLPGWALPISQPCGLFLA